MGDAKRWDDWLDGIDMSGGRPVRDPNRVPELLEALRSYWTAHPDLRLGQILGNYNITCNTEDSVLLEALRGESEVEDPRIHP